MCLYDLYYMDFNDFNQLKLTRLNHFYVCYVFIQLIFLYNRCLKLILMMFDHIYLLIGNIFMSYIPLYG